jgi:pyrroloquinoline quinone biosynthesis protein D
MKGKQASLRRTIRLATGYQLRKDRTLVSPKGSVQLNDSAALILELCNGRLSEEEVIARVLRAKGKSLAEDVRAFLDAAQRRGWVVHR